MLFKIDIAHDFDFVAWPFMLELLQHLGFPTHWRDWISALLSSASTRVLLNGNPGYRICHAHRLRQGDSLSPMLFLLVMEVLNDLIHKDDEWKQLKPLGASGITHRVSFYADHLDCFLSSEQQDMQMACMIMSLFEGCSGLGCNMNKCHVAAIQCTSAQVQLATCRFSPTNRWNFR
jgi:hypothetical protein